MRSISKLGHVALVTEDLGKSVEFWRDVVGLNHVETHDNTVFFRAWGDWEHHTLSLREGPTGVDHVAWRAGAPEDVADYAARLRELDIETTPVAADEERGQGEAIRFALPGAGHTYEIYFDVEKPRSPEELRSRLKNQPGRAWAKGASPRCLDHVNLQAEDPVTGRDFMVEEMGFRVNEEAIHTQQGTFGSWMSVTSLAHDIAFTAPTGPFTGPRFHHVAYFFDNWQDVLRAADICREANVQIDLGPARHGISQAMFCYVRDPGSGHRLELFSGGYHIYDPDWQKVVWDETELEEGLVWWGERFLPGSGHLIDESTSGAAPTPAGV
jgi:biphenyl-2,3-diol 1,2-dioxygenase